MGKPPWIPTQLDIDNAESYASRGLTKKDIAEALGICYDTLNEKSKIHTEFADALKRGRAKGVAHVANLLVKNAEQMNVSAQIFYLKAVGKWSDQNLEEVKDAIKNELDTVREMVQQCMRDQTKS